MAVPRKEKAYEKHAWILLFLLGIVSSPVIVFLLFSAPANYANRFLELGFVVTTVLISSTSYRKGKKWAWYLLWYVPVVFVISSYEQYVDGSAPLVATFPFVIISLLGLLLPYRKFFPKAQVAPK